MKTSTSKFSWILILYQTQSAGKQKGCLQARAPMLRRHCLKLFTFLTCKKGESWLICLIFFSGGSDFCPSDVLLIINRRHWKSPFATHLFDIQTTFSLLVHRHAGSELASQASPQHLILIISHRPRLLDYCCYGECIWNFTLECEENISPPGDAPEQQTVSDAQGWKGLKTSDFISLQVSIWEQGYPRS